MADPWKPRYLVLHDYGGSPKNQDGMFNPYNALVFPDGAVRYRNPENPYGVRAPHAFRLNPYSVGLSYAGAVGSTPTAEAMNAIRREYERVRQMYPDIEVKSHGEAYRDTRGTAMQASRAGRGLDEASWRTQLLQPQPIATAPPVQPQPAQTSAPAGAVAAQPSAPTMASRSLIAHAGLERPPTQALPDAAPANQPPVGAVAPPQANMALGGPKPPPTPPTGAVGGGTPDAEAQPGGFYGSKPTPMIPASAPKPLDQTFSPEARRWNDMGFTPAPGFVDQPMKPKPLQMNLGALGRFF